MIRLVFLFFVAFISIFLIASSPGSKIPDADLVSKKILRLHEFDGVFIWNECGRKIRGEEAKKRSMEYADAIVTSISDLYDRTGELIDYRHVIALLFRESSHDECAIGKQEIRSLPGAKGKARIVNHIKKWFKARRVARRHCIESKGGSGCRGNFMNVHYPEYEGVRGWDIGVAQYRYPGCSVSNRDVVMPDGRVLDKIGLEQLFDYDVSIQMMVEDLVSHKKVCRRHNHIVRGKRIPTDDAYFVHHHTGTHNWSVRYWRATRRHLRLIDSGETNRITSILCFPALVFFDKKS